MYILLEDVFFEDGNSVLKNSELNKIKEDIKENVCQVETINNNSDIKIIFWINKDKIVKIN